MIRRDVLGASLLALGLAACGGGEGTDADNGQNEQALGANCETSYASTPVDAWICGDDLVVECEGAVTDVPTIHVVASDFVQSPNICLSGDTFEVNDPGPFGVGEHDIEVSRVDASGASTLLCTSTLTVEDTTPPEIVQTNDMNIWPPNHKWHTIRPEDCVVARDACDPDVEAVFLWASSDEPMEGSGDGNHEPDIRNLDCDGVELRAERSGNENGRVYKLGVRVYDDEGQSSDATCIVTVVHDQSGAVAVDDGEDHRLELTEAECAPADNGGETGGENGGGTPDPGNNGGETGGEGPVPPGGL